MFIRKIFSAAVFAIALSVSGCATTSPYGNYLTHPARVDQTQLAADAVKQLVKLYPPARSRLALQQATPDAFGQSLVKALRGSGYAVLETPKIAAPSSSVAPKQGPKTYPLWYLVDTVGDSNLCRLTLLVGTQTLTRVYLRRDDGHLVPAGAWVHKE